MKELMGRSARAMFCAYFDYPVDEGDIPYDADDFSRCLSLARRLSLNGSVMAFKAIKYNPKWLAVSTNWDFWTKLYDNDTPDLLCRAMTKAYEEFK